MFRKSAVELPERYVPKERKVNPPNAPPAAGTLPAADLEDLLAGLHADPFGVLGPHAVPEGLALRAFLPGAAEAWVVRGPETARVGAVPMTLLHADGIFEAILPGRALPFRDYQLRAKSALGAEWISAIHTVSRRGCRSSISTCWAKAGTTGTSNVWAPMCGRSKAFAGSVSRSGRQTPGG